MMFYKFFGLLILFSSVIAASHDLKDFDIEIIVPSSGSPDYIESKVSKITGIPFDEKNGTSEDQVFADELLKFRKLDKSLKSKHKVIWALRGGYGMDKLMPHIASSDYSKEPKKIIIGYSDLTPFMIHMHQKYGWVAISAPMLKDFANNDKSKESYQTIIKLLKGQQSILKFSDLIPLNKYAKNQKISGKITGGNLTCIISTIGTSWQIKTSNKIIFIEDTNIDGYHLDRLLTHMKNAKLFDKATAIVFGDFGKNVSKILKTFATKVNLPVFKSNSFGHQRVNLPFGYGFDGTIKSSKEKAEIVMRPSEDLDKILKR